MIEQGAHHPEILAALETAPAALRGKLNPLPYQTPEEDRLERRKPVAVPVLLR